MHQQQLSGIKDVQARLTKISVENSEATTTNSETASWTRNELQTLPSRISELVVEEVSTTMAKKHATCTTILTEIRENGMRADQSNEDIRLALQPLLSSENTGKIAALLLPALEKAVSDRIAASLEGLTAHSVTAQPESIRQVTNAGSSLNNIPQEQELQSSVMSLNSLSSTTTCISWAGDSRVFGFWFGKLLVTNSTMITWQGCGDDVNIRKTEFLETKATLIPSRWLLRKGVILTIRRLVSAIVAPVVHFSLTPIMVISGGHEIVYAMYWGNITRVKSLVLNGNVHPSSVFPDDSTLVHKCLQMMHSGSLNPLEYSGSDKKKFLESWGDLGLDSVRNNLASFKVWDDTILGTASWLIDQGPDLDQINSNGECCFSTLVNLFHSHLMQNANREVKRQLAVLLLRASKCSPLIIRHEESMQVLPTETFRTANTQMWNFAEVIVEASRFDNSTLTCLVVLQAICNFPPYQQDNELWMSASVFEIPETGLRLIQKAIAGKMWLAGDSQDSARCSYLLYRSILGALVFASPYKAHEHRAYVWWLIRLSQQKDIHRTRLINLIAGMLQFDTNIVSVGDHVEH
ncbi:uncharacterized protein PAC_06542 [Phialocephala subalpina]|uniref:Uncharacterized protein n=1 Tax=Phialocephala subalpina TaxID=576137 RepID=A0A1L7WVB3_9HELO|nr:uncharacterized protein PAC_06542 [Phialocephala subalpina]